MTEKTPKAKKASAKAVKAPKADSATGDFAVIATGGKQYKVSQGDSILIEKMKGEYTEGDVISFDKVLLLSQAGKANIGTPTVAGAKVQAVITKIGRAKKVTVIKYKQKSRYFKKNGHRQPFFKVSISAIQ